MKEAPIKQWALSYQEPATPRLQIFQKETEISMSEQQDYIQ